RQSTPRRDRLGTAARAVVPSTRGYRATIGRRTRPAPASPPCYPTTNRRCCTRRTERARDQAREAVACDGNPWFIPPRTMPGRDRTDIDAHVVPRARPRPSHRRLHLLRAEGRGGALDR